MILDFLKDLIQGKVECCYIVYHQDSLPLARSILRLYRQGNIDGKLLEGKIETENGEFVATPEKMFIIETRTGGLLMSGRFYMNEVNLKATT